MTASEKDQQVIDLALKVSGNNREIAAARLRLRAMYWDVQADASTGDQAEAFKRAAADRRRVAALLEGE